MLLEPTLPKPLPQSPGGDRVAWGVLQALPQALLVIDGAGLIRFANPAAETLLGQSADQVLDRPWEQVLKLSRAAETGDVPCGLTAIGDGPEDADYLLRRDDGSQRVVQLRVAPIAMAESMANGQLLTLRDCTVAHQRLRMLERQCASDHLTNLVNRREFERRLASVLRRSALDASDHVLMFMDLDGFKSVNDEHGHLAGDKVLRQIADTLTTAVRDRDTLARLGGDEFALLMEHCLPEQGLKAAQTLCLLLGRQDFSWRGSRLQIGISIGVAVVNRRSGDIARIWANADDACYRAKRLGGGQVQLYDTASPSITAVPRASADSDPNSRIGWKGVV